MKWTYRLCSSLLLLLFFVPSSSLALIGSPSGQLVGPPSGPWKINARQVQFLDQLEKDTFSYFWDSTDPRNGLTPDRFPGDSESSVAAVGFSLTSYLVGVERHYITRAEAAARTLTTLRTLADGPQGPATSNVNGYKGFYYHFLDMKTGLRANRSELSTIDTALLMAGVLSAQTYFDADNPTEAQIRTIADNLYRRIDWPWFYDRKHQPLLSMGWYPENGFGSAYWGGYNEGMILYILALGSPSHPIAGDSWAKWTGSYRWDTFYNYPFVNFGPLFAYQYSHAWIDFRAIQDGYMQAKGIDYFTNSRRATYASRAYCIANPGGWRGYGQQVWGLTACDGPGEPVIGKESDGRVFYRYWARGTGAGYRNDDGTIAPTAVGGSIPFAPEITIPTLQYLKERFGGRLYGKYGFKDAFNLSFRTPAAAHGWFDNQYIAIDQGPILLMTENYRTGFIWNLMKNNKYIRNGLVRAGFTGGWLGTEVAADKPAGHPSSAKESNALPEEKPADAQPGKPDAKA
ncbi:MAG: hypothetical protein M0017_00265 [Desulfobacteraceae bacterium]|nr:hypothetical protein [Desulfobacteraceae bacterium]